MEKYKVFINQLISIKSIPVIKYAKGIDLNDYWQSNEYNQFKNIQFANTLKIKYQFSKIHSQFLYVNNKLIVLTYMLIIIN